VVALALAGSFKMVHHILIQNLLSHCAAYNALAALVCSSYNFFTAL
jgi:hypothetical protein